MSLAYQAVLWNRQKRIYDGVLLGGVSAYVALFLGIGAVFFPGATVETLIIRCVGTLALLLLHIILSIGPLCRLDRRFLPLLYNRRHLGVTMFVLAFIHGTFAVVQFHALSDTNPLISMLSTGGPVTALSTFPFQPLGFAALIILFLMASTSHDFWLANLTAPVWKSLHMLVYVAYGLLILHVVLGVLQAETNPLFLWILGGGFAWIVSIHLIAGFREMRRDREPMAREVDGYVPFCSIDEIPPDRAQILSLGGERVAVFKYDGKVSAVSNVCQHQNGPLGEGKVIDGCITCPWHGYQYAPDTGSSPPPFTERIPTFNVRVQDGMIWVDPRPNAPGTPVQPARADGGRSE